MTETNQITPQISYATATGTNYNNLYDVEQDIIPPTMDLGIIIQAYSEINLRDYIVELGKIIDPFKITDASRMSQNRIFVFFSDKKSVDTLINQKTIQVKNKISQITKLDKPNIKIIISNCSPTIPNSIILSELIKLNIKPASPITRLKAGIQTPFTHIRSFRRQVYITPNENNELPNNIMITYNNIKFKMFLMEDNIRCRTCNRHGHTEIQCYFTRNQQSQQTPSSTITEQTTNNLIININQEETQPTQQLTTQNNNETIEIEQTLQPMTTESLPATEQQETAKTQPQQTIVADTQHQKTTQLPNNPETSKPHTLNQEENLPTKQKPEKQPTFETTENKSEKQGNQQFKQQLLQEWQQKIAILSKENQNDEINNENTLENMSIQFEQFEKFFSQISDSKIPNQQSSTPNKRPATSIASSEENLQTENTQEKPKTTKPKKQKHYNEIDDQLKLIKEEMEKNQDKYKLTYAQFRDFFENAQGNKENLLEMASEYTSDKNILPAMLYDLYPFLHDSKIKNKFTRLRNKLNTLQNGDDLLES